MNTKPSEVPISESKILVISDNLSNIKVLRKNLSARGYEVELALDNAEALDMAASNTYALLIIILDFTNSQINGLELCEQLSHACQTPIIALSSDDSEAFKVKAFDYGIDDFLVLPFNLEEFLARVRSSIRRWTIYKASNVKDERIIVVHDLYINIETRNVTVHGKKVRLTPTEYEILLYMARNKGKVISHRELLKAIWGDAYGNEREYLRVYISQIRKKIDVDMTHLEYLITEPGIGYRFSTD